MDLVLVEEVVFDAPVAEVWALCTAADQMSSFVGWGPIPGIASVRYREGEGVAPGALREITNADGSTHREEIVAVEPHRRLEDRVHGLGGPVRFVVREMVDVWEFASSGSGTRLRRTFTLALRSPLAWPLGAALRFAFRRALRRHHAELAARVAP